MKKSLTFLAIFFLAVLITTTNGCKEDDDNNDPAPNPDEVAFNNADVNNGGRLYDKFWASETDFTSPSDPTVKIDDIKNYGDFYRCKQCHAWDLLGNAASYIDRGPTVSRPDVSSLNLFAKLASLSNRQIFDRIKNTGGAAVDPARTADGTNTSLGGNDHPDYGTILTDDQIWDLVKFLKKGVYDVTLLYDINTTGTYPSGSRDFTNVGKDGDAAAGTLFYKENCAGCHGDNGRDDENGQVIDINVDIGRSMGEFAREKPYELQHKTRFGNLGSSPKMLGTDHVPIADVKNMLKALANTTNYPDLN